MRHADSIERADPQTRDHERSITDIGRQAAAQVRYSLHAIEYELSKTADAVLWHLLPD